MPWKFAFLLFAAIVAFGAAGCGAQASERVGRCAERIAERVRSPQLSRTALERYAERAYCRPFDRRGWVYGDGTLRLAAYTRSGSCSIAKPGQAPHQVSCEEAEGGILDCGLLRFVRREEAQSYITRLKRAGPVRCDDDTPLDEVGA